jgi:hypothetical protein
VELMGATTFGRVSRAAIGNRKERKDEEMKLD